MKITVKTSEKRYIEHVLDRDNIPYTIISDENGETVLNVSDEADKEEIMEDVRCEQQRESTDSKFPVYSYRTLQNKAKRDRLMSFYGRRGFHVLKSDETKCRNAGLI